MDDADAEQFLRDAFRWVESNPFATEVPWIALSTNFIKFRVELVHICATATGVQ
jgi:hypothetical protein